MGDPEKAVQTAVNSFVDRRINERLAEHQLSRTEEGAERQCASGNPAACH